MSKLNENNYVSFFLSPDEISSVFIASCDTVRNSCRCPNDRLCKDLFQEENYFSIVLHERQKMWKLDSKVCDMTVCVMCLSVCFVCMYVCMCDLLCMRVRVFTCMC